MTITLAILAVVLFLTFVARVVAEEDFWLPREAKRRARKLFLARLNDRQRESWESVRSFDVTGASGCCYTISSYGIFNIRNWCDEFCVVVVGDIPVYDKLLAQRLLIETDETLFLALANRRRRYKLSA